jgi:glutamyl/glutaminyl-tRNA synthetase
VYVHHPLILRPDGRKLSKATGDTAVRELRGKGWSAERVRAAAIESVNRQSAIGNRELDGTQS